MAETAAKAGTVCLVSSEAVEHGRQVLGGALHGVEGRVGRGGGVPVADQVDGDDAVAGGKRGTQGLPGGGAAREAVQEQQRGAARGGGAGDLGMER
jgi:hypothetical protein